jgi:hypothetical protein
MDQESHIENDSNGSAESNDTEVDTLITDLVSLKMDDFNKIEVHVQNSSPLYL